MISPTSKEGQVVLSQSRQKERGREEAELKGKEETKRLPQFVEMSESLIVLARNIKQRWTGRLCLA